MQTYLNRITDYILTQSWQIAVLVMVVAIVALLLRNRSAHVRYLLWLIVLAKCLVPPLLEVPVAVLPEKAPAPAIMPSPISMMTEMPLEIAEPTKPVPVAAPAAVSRPQLSARQWLAIVWLISAVAFASIAAVKAWRTVRWLHRDRRQLPADVQTGVNSLLSSLNLRKLPRMWLIEGIGQPFVWGALRGDIYLPTSFVRIPDDEHRRHVLGHELSHVMRFDAAVNLVQTIAQAILWFHPFVWWANRKIRAEREKCCDETAIARLNARAKDYSRAIVETLVTEYESTRPVPSLAIAGPVKNIEERIKIMLKPGKKFYKHPSVPVLLIVGLIALLAVPTALVLTARAGTATGFGNPTNLGPSVNSSAHEYDPSISADELELYFNSYRPGSFGEYDIWMTTRKTKADPWGIPVNLGPTVNSPAGELAPSISTDGLSLYFSSDRSGGYGVQDIWVTTRETKSAPWGEPVNLGPTVNSVAREHAPSISTDGLELYFSGLWEFPESSRPGGSGGSDIWVTTRKTKRDPWGTPVNLGPAVNSTTYDESPSISGDGLSLYFYSHRSGGSGESDIWVTKRKSTSDPWGTPVNLGPTVNSVSMEGNPDISRDGCTLYFASRRPGGSGGSDLWQVSLGKHGAKEDSAPEDEKRQPTKSLHQAAADGDLEQVRLLLSQGADVNVKDQRGRAALHRAANTGHVEVARLLIEYGADVNIGDNLKRTPLEHAAVAGHTEVARLLIDKGANPNALNRDGLTPLHVAAGSSNKETVKLLIDKGADVTLNNDAGKTPLHDAMMSANANRREIVELIVATGKVPSTIHLAAYMGDLAKVKTFIEEGVAVNEKEAGGGTALHYAAAGGQKEVAQLLLAQGADVNVKVNDGMGPLHAAVFYSDNAETVNLLISNGANVNNSASVEDDSGMSVLGLRLLRCVMQSLSKNDDVMTAKTKSLWNSDVTNVLISNGARFGDSDKKWLSIVEEMDIPEIKELAPTKSDDENEKQPDHSVTLHQAAAEGDVEQVTELLAAGAAINTRDENGETPLYRAARYGRKQVAELLVAKGADVNAKENRWGGTPLSWTTIGDYRDLAGLLIANGANVNSKGHYGWTPLHDAAWHGARRTAELLLAKGADINAKAQRWAGTPLHSAATQGHKDVAELLLAKGADINAGGIDGYTPLQRAASKGYRDVVELFIAKGADVSSFHLAACIGDLARVRRFCDEAIDVDRKDKLNWTPLNWAAFTGQRNVVEFLAARGADVNARDGLARTPLYHAASNGHKEIVEVLLINGADVNGRDGSRRTALHHAARNGHKEIVVALLAKGADINARCGYSKTPVEHAMGENQREVVELLVSKGADISPLLLAAGTGDLARVKSLIEEGADVNIRTQAEITPLCYAVHQGSKDIARLLIDNGAEVDTEDNWNWTPLHSAAETGHKDLAELLIAKGANVNAKDGASLSPLWYAQHEGYIAIVELLLKHGAKE